MLVALFAKDKPGALQVRKDNREAHLAYIKETGAVVQAGPLMNEAGEMCGSLVILDLPDMQTAQDWAANDPYARAGLFESAELVHWNRVIG